MGNGYTLARQWFDFAAENPELITVNQTALYAMLIDLNNRKGWAEKFNFNTQDACDLIGVKNRKTIWEALNKLVEFGFVTIIYKANAPGKASVISIVNNTVLSNGCLDTALINQSVKRTGEETVDKQYRNTLSPGTEIVDGHSLKQENNKQKNNKQSISPTLEEVKIFFFNEGFEEDGSAFHNYYESVGWLVGKSKAMKNWQAAARNWIRRSEIFKKEKNSAQKEKNEQRGAVGVIKGFQNVERIKRA